MFKIFVVTLISTCCIYLEPGLTLSLSSGSKFCCKWQQYSGYWM